MKIKTVDRFILKSYLGPMIATFFIVMFILMMNGLWLYIDEIVGKGLPFSAIVKLIYYFSVTMVPLGLPLATLLAAIMTMGNLGENYELTALKSAGISLVRIIRPILILAVFISIASFFVINNYVPYSVRQLGKVLSDIRSQRQEIEFIDGMFFNGIPNISIRVEKQDKKTKQLTGVLIYDNRDRSVSKTIVADSGYIAISDDKEYMNIKLNHGSSFEDNRNYQWYDKPFMRVNDFEQQVMILKLDGFNFSESGSNIFAGRSDTKNISELQHDIDSINLVAEKRINDFSSSFLKNYFYRMDTLVIHKNSKDSLLFAKAQRQNAIITRETVDTLSITTKKNIFEDADERLSNLVSFSDGGHSQVTGSTITLYRSKADWHKKIALPISVFIFFLIGAPLGAIIRRGGLGMPVVISVIFFVFYYMMSISGERMVWDGAWIPFAGMWLSSFILAPIAIFLTLKARSDSQLLNAETYYNLFKKTKNYLQVIKEKTKKYARRKNF